MSSIAGGKFDDMATPSRKLRKGSAIGAPRRRTAITASVGFAPVAKTSARILLVGTLPGQTSLAKREYYAQSRNAFWPIMGALFGAGPDLPYRERLRRLVAQRVALWDVCESAGRPGSLDSSIAVASILPNDFRAFFTDHPHIGLIGLNGLRAHALYNRLVRPGLTPAMSEIRQLRLPSTSPAHASMPYARKLAEWSRVRHVLPGVRRQRERRCG